jgi:hypothetical protein
MESKWDYRPDPRLILDGVPLFATVGVWPSENARAETCVVLCLALRPVLMLPMPSAGFYVVRVRHPRYHPIVANVLVDEETHYHIQACEDPIYNFADGQLRAELPWFCAHGKLDGSALAKVIAAWRLGGEHAATQIADAVYGSGVEYVDLRSEVKAS